MTFWITAIVAGLFLGLLVRVIRNGWTRAERRLVLMVLVTLGGVLVITARIRELLGWQ